MSGFRGGWWVGGAVGWGHPVWNCQDSWYESVDVKRGV